MNNGDKQKKLFELLETPKEDRPKHLKYPSQIKRELGISPIQYDNWEKEFHEQKFRDVQEQLHKLSANLEELEKIALAGDDKKMADLARKKMWVIGMHEGNYKSLESYLKATGEFIEKKEETIKHEFTADERIKIARELYAEIRGGKGKGGDTLPSQPLSLS